jgi:hypothetical protein
MVIPAMKLFKVFSKAIEIVICLGVGIALIVGSIYAVANGVAIVGSGPDAALYSLIVWMILVQVGTLCIAYPFDW